MATSTVPRSTPIIYTTLPSIQEDIIQAPLTPESLCSINSKPKTLGSDAFREMMQRKAEMMLKGMAMKADVGLHSEEDM